MNFRIATSRVLRTWAPATLAVAVAAATLMHGASAGPQRLDVVELFTSQGCSSCPPADEMLAEMAGHEDVLALSYNVDYWDYLGWKDTLAQPDFTARQKAYAHARGDRDVYTPQAVVNGLMHAVGSDAAGLKDARQSTGDRLRDKAVGLRVTREGGSIVVQADGLDRTGGRKKATVWLVTYDPSRTVVIERGENSGRTATYTNVVRHIDKIGVWKGEPITLNVPMPDGPGVKCAVLIQEGDADKPGAILAAARL